MTIHSNLESYLGKPVVDFDPEQGLRDAAGKAIRVRTAYEGGPFGALWEAFLACPESSLVRDLIVGAWWTDSPYDDDVSVVVEALTSAKEKLPGLRALFLGDIQVEEAEISWIRQGDLSRVWVAFPDLEHVRIRGGDGLSLGGNFALAKLQSLIIETGGMPKSVLREVLAARLPMLEHLELWLGDDGYGCDVEPGDLQPLLATRAFPRLKSLALRNCHFADALAELVAGAPLLGQLASLDLSLGTLGDKGARALLASPQIKRLESLDLHHHYISTGVQKELGRLGIKLDLGEAEEGDEGDRYVAVSE